MVQPTAVFVLPTQPVSNFACITANTKRKMAINELEDTLNIMAEKNKKKKRLQDKDVEETKRLAEKRITEQLQHKLKQELELWRIDIKEKRLEKKYNLKMKKLELLEQGIFIPNKDDSIPTSTSNQIEKDTNHVD